jgi:hypothetical protein
MTANRFNIAQYARTESTHGRRQIKDAIIAAKSRRTRAEREILWVWAWVTTFSVAIALSVFWVTALLQWLFTPFVAGAWTLATRLAGGPTHTA